MANNPPMLYKTQFPKKNKKPKNALNHRICQYLSALVCLAGWKMQKNEAEVEVEALFEAGPVIWHVITVPNRRDSVYQKSTEYSLQPTSIEIHCLTEKE